MLIWGVAEEGEGFRLLENQTECSSEDAELIAVACRLNECQLFIWADFCER